MKQDSILKEHGKIILLLFVFTCLSGYLAYNNGKKHGFAVTSPKPHLSLAVRTGNNNIANGYAGTPDINRDMTDGDIWELSGAFAPFVSMCGSPFIALTVLSGAGSLFNSGVLSPANIPFSETLTQLPISRTGVFITLLSITIVKFLLSILGPSKVFSDATLGKLENYVGTVCTVGGAFLLTSITTAYAANVATFNLDNVNVGAFISTKAYAADVVTLHLGNAGFWTYIVTNIIAFFLAVSAYAVYVVIKTMILAVDILAFLLSPIPGTTSIFTFFKYLIMSLYTWYTLSNPFVASVIGLICLVIAFLVFRKARRLEIYYRKIYLIPLFNALFRKGRSVPLVPKKLPYGLRNEFNSVDICVQCFFMNKGSAFYKRELCYFVRADGVNFLFKKRLFGKVIKTDISSDAYIEKTFRFIRIFTDETSPAEKRKISVVVSREHNGNIAEIIDKTGLVDYNAILEERRRKKAEEAALKAKQMKEEAARKMQETGKAIKNVFGGLFASKCGKCGMEIDKNDKFCGSCGTAV